MTSPSRKTLPCALQAWCDSLGLRCTALQLTCCATPGAANSAGASTPAVSSCSTASADGYAHHSWGLITTAAVQVGEVLLSAPPHAVVPVDNLQQTIVSLACFAFQQPAEWHTRWVSCRAPSVQLQHEARCQVDAAAPQLRQADAGAAGQLALQCLAVSWLSEGTVKATLAARLLLAQLWPHHASSEQATQLAAALEGEALYPLADNCAESSINSCTFWR